MKNLTINTYKWFLAILIFLVSIMTGLASVRFINRHTRLLHMGDALANGVFIGAAFFHLLPDAADHFYWYPVFSYLFVSFIAAITFILLTLLEERFATYTHSQHQQMNAWLFTTVLGIHALITGIALGLAGTLALISMIFIAIIAHKCFEMFALVVKLHKQSVPFSIIKIIASVFSLVTPLGIAIGLIGFSFAQSRWNDSLVAYFNAVAAGTFLYIGTVHSQHEHHQLAIDSYQRYNLVLVTIAGIVAMGILAIWI